MNKKSKMIIYLYIALLAIGGIMGYVMSKSHASLVASFASALALFLSITFIKPKKASLTTTVILLVLLDSFFAYRYALTSKFFPAGIMSLVTFAFIIVFMKKSK